MRREGMTTNGGSNGSAPLPAATVSLGFQEKGLPISIERIKCVYYRLRVLSTLAQMPTHGCYMVSKLQSSTVLQCLIKAIWTVDWTVEDC